MYRYLDIAMLSMILFQDQDLSNINIGLLELAIGFIIGFSPVLFGAIKEKVKWGTERKVIETQANINQTEAIENIAQAASMLLDQSQQLSDKNASLVNIFEEAFIKQSEETKKERALRHQQEEMYLQKIQEIKVGSVKREEKYIEEMRLLQEQIEEINSLVKICSSEIIGIVSDLQKGKEISKERLDRLKDKWLID